MSTIVEPTKPDYSLPWVKGWEYIDQEGTSFWTALREERGWSREDVWELTGGLGAPVTPGRQSDFECDYGVGFPELHELEALAVIYDCSPGALLDRCYEEKGRELIAEDPSPALPAKSKEME